MKIENATNLEELKAAMIANPSADWTELPEFGGDEIENPIEVWSWDETRVLVGTCADDLEILSRDDEDAWWN